MVTLPLSGEIPMEKYRLRSAARYSLYSGDPNLVRAYPCKYPVNCLQFDDTKMICGAQYHLAIFENCFDDNLPSIGRRLIEGHNGMINDLQFDSTKIVTGASDAIKIWDIDEFTCESTIDVEEPVSCVKFFDNKLYSHSNGNTLKVHDLNTQQCIYTRKFNDSVPDRQQIDISDDGRTLVVASSMVYVVDTRSHEVVNAFMANPQMQTLCHGVADRGYMCAFNDDFILYDIFTGKSVLDFEGSGYGEVKCMYSNYGILAAGFDYCDIRLWDLKTGNIITDIYHASVLAPDCVMFDESKLICGSGQTKANMYMFGNVFEDEVGLLSEIDKAMVRKWTNRMQFYK